MISIRVHQRRSAVPPLLGPDGQNTPRASAFFRGSHSPFLRGAPRPRIHRQRRHGAATMAERLRNWASGRCLAADRAGIYSRGGTTTERAGRNVKRGDPSAN